jgi:hypothetical protein
MSKLPMYIIISVAMTLGAYIPVLFGASPLGFVSILGSVIGGIGGIFAYSYLRSGGFLE